MTDPISLARRFARRLGFGPKSVRVVFDGRRRYGCVLIKRVEPHRRGGRYHGAETWIAVPGSWAEPQTVTLGKPKTLISFVSPTRREWNRLHRYTRLGRYCKHALATRIAFGAEPSIESQKLFRDIIARGTLKADLSLIAKPTELDRELQRMLVATS